MYVSTQGCCCFPLVRIYFSLAKIYFSPWMPKNSLSSPRKNFGLLTTTTFMCVATSIVPGNAARLAF